MNPFTKLTLPLLTLALVLGLSIITSTVSAQSGGTNSQIEEEKPLFSYYDDCELTGDCPGSNGNSVAIADNGVLPSIQLSPNPTVGNLMKVWYSRLTGTSTLRLLDLSGKVIYKSYIGSDRDKEGLYEVNTSHLSPGVYIVQLQSGLYKAAKKIIIRN